MEKQIWKFPLHTFDMQTLKMSAGYEILTVQLQAEQPCLWAIVDPSEFNVDVHIEIFGTGNPIYFDMGVERKYVGTYQLSNGALVFHVFHRIN